MNGLMVSRGRIIRMKNTDIAAVFENIADLLELKGENKFKIRDYADMVAHPTCRKIGEREPVDVDQEAVFNTRPLKEVLAYLRKR
jgi:hypothetical protein